MQTTKQTTPLNNINNINNITNINNNSQATKCNHSPLFGRGAGGEAIGATKCNHSPLSWRGAGGEAVEAVCSMTRKELADWAGVSERTLRRWIQRSHQQLVASGYQPSQRKLSPRVVRLLMDFYGIEKM